MPRWPGRSRYSWPLGAAHERVLWERGQIAPLVALPPSQLAGEETHRRLPHLVAVGVDGPRLDHANSVAGALQRVQPPCLLVGVLGPLDGEVVVAGAADGERARCEGGEQIGVVEPGAGVPGKDSSASSVCPVRKNLRTSVM